MPSKTRLANKTIWALEDIAARCQAARARWEQAMRLSEERMDPLMMLLLARLRDDLAEIERMAKDARHGDYHETQ